TMADRIAVLNKGQIVQVGTPIDIYDHPATTFVAQLVGIPRINLLPAARENGKFHVAYSEIHMALPAEQTVPPSFLLGIRPEDVKITAEGEQVGDIILTEPMGVETVIHIRSGQQKLLSIVPGITDLKIGDKVNFTIVRERLHYFDPAGVRL
ncbi:MAG: ABC transporter ATP-binding protein, partial [Chloroflexi bacterium]